MPHCTSQNQSSRYRKKANTQLMSASQEMLRFSLGRFLRLSRRTEDIIYLINANGLRLV